MWDIWVVVDLVAGRAWRGRYPYLSISKETHRRNCFPHSESTVYVRERTSNKVDVVPPSDAEGNAS